MAHIARASAVKRMAFRLNVGLCERANVGFAMVMFSLVWDIVFTTASELDTEV